MKLGGIITAAGLSTRMGDFKPLLTINGVPMICHTVNSMKNAGISPVCVVTGYRGQEIRGLFREEEVLFAENPDPSGSDMLASVKIGLAELRKDRACEGFFLLPADMPLIAPGVFRTVQHTAEQTGADYVVPAVNGKAAHPPLIGRACWNAIMDYSGEGGLRAALNNVEKVTVETGTAEMNRDADTPEDFEEISRYAAWNLGLSDDLCKELWREAGTPDKVMNHCRLVAEVAERLAKNLVKAGYGLDIMLCRSGGMLHDVLRTEKYHPEAGAVFLRRHGYLRLADITERHMTFERQKTEWSEELVVCLADKLIRNDVLLTPRQRYAKAFEQFPEKSGRGSIAREDCAAAEKLVERYEKETGDTLFAIGEKETKNEVL